VAVRAGPAMALQSSSFIFPSRKFIIIMAEVIICGMDYLNLFLIKPFYELLNYYRKRDMNELYQY
jgi:hypothetical protein